MIVSNLLNKNSNKLDIKLALKHYDISSLVKASQEYKDYFTSNEYLKFKYLLLSFESNKNLV